MGGEKNMENYEHLNELDKLVMKNFFILFLFALLKLVSGIIGLILLIKVNFTIALGVTLLLFSYGSVKSK